MNTQSRKLFDKLYKYAIENNDSVLGSMLNAFSYSPAQWDSWEDFLANTIIALSAANGVLREQLLEVLRKQTSPRPILISSVGVIPGWGSSEDNNTKHGE